VTAPVVVILAAGRGTRMRSAVPKVLHPVCGRPMVLWPVAAALAAGASRVVVVDGPDRALESVLPDGVELVVQAQARGTGDAIRAAEEHFAPDAPVIVLSGDVPLVTAETIGELAAAHDGARAVATLVTMRLDDPSGYGRVVRSAGGGVERVVETKAEGDATPDELAIDEVNAGLYAFDGGALRGALEHLRADNAQGEYYLPDLLPLLRAEGGIVAALEVDDSTVALGVNDRAGLAAVTALAQRRILRAHMQAGVTFLAAESTLVDAEVQIGEDTVIGPGCSLLGETNVGGRCHVGPATTLTGATLGDDVSVLHSYLDSCRVEDGSSVGPFAYLRPGAVLRPGAKAGTFVEIKNSDIGAGARVPHLSYIGDADVGEGTNLGAATITANYDGARKHRTRLGARVRTGVDTTLVAPVTVGDDASTGAGSVITEDVPDGALGIARERQRNVEGYAERRRPEPGVDSKSR
jgi:bifunctional UDP-N-acetylglucosamine pyrophosphorylase/glucosamine-1-phosphate N-acetyltransferase